MSNQPTEFELGLVDGQNKHMHHETKLTQGNIDRWSDAVSEHKDSEFTSTMTPGIEEQKQVLAGQNKEAEEFYAENKAALHILASREAVARELGLDATTLAAPELDAIADAQKVEVHTPDQQ